MPRTARQSRPQLICVLADNSGSMFGPKAKAATDGIREMLMRCQSQGPRGPERSYFRFVLIQFGTRAEVDPRCNMTPVRQIDPETIEVRGSGGGTNITEALELAYSGLQKYMREVVEPHSQRSEHPLPLVLLFSDGQNGHGDPVPMAQKIKALNIDGEAVVIACAGVATDNSDQPDENLLRAIASPECYLRIAHAEMLSAFLAEVGSSGVSTAHGIGGLMRQVAIRRGTED